MPSRRPAGWPGGALNVSTRSALAAARTWASVTCHGVRSAGVITAWLLPSGAPEDGRAGHPGRDTRHFHQVQVVAGQVEQQAGQFMHARVGRDGDGHRLPLAGLPDRFPGALRFLARLAGQHPGAHPEQVAQLVPAPAEADHH